MDELGTSVAQDEFVLCIDVRPPMADFNGAFVARYLKHGLFMVVTNGDRCLVLLDEIVVRGGRNVVERAISNCSTRLGSNVIGSEPGAFRSGKGDDAGNHGPGLVNYSASREWYTDDTKHT